MIGQPISLTEAVKLERQRVFRKFETRMLIAIELARRGAVRKRSDELDTIARDQQVVELFNEVINESARAGFGWLILGQFGKRRFPTPDDLVRESFIQAKQEAEDWLLQIVAQIVGCEIRGAS